MHSQCSYCTEAKHCTLTMDGGSGKPYLSSSKVKANQL